MKLTRHNGRSGKNGTYNPRHNDRKFDIKNSEHIDEERAKYNVYWDCYQGYHFPADQEQEEKIAFSFEQVERAFYAERYDDFCEGQHERNRKTGHSNRDRTTEDLRMDKKTCPEESLIQIGTMEKSVPPDVLAEIAIKFFEEFERLFGEYVHILDWSLHLDEATPHIHERHVFDCENRYGEIAPQQEKALEALGFPLPHPDQKPGKTNNRKMTFDASCRALLFKITKEHGLNLDQEPEYGGREYLEKQEYILMKQKEKIAEQEKALVKKDQELEELTLKIEDVDKFVDEVSETAYQKACEVVTDSVREKTQQEDMKILRDYQKWIISPDRKTLKMFRDYIGKCLDELARKMAVAAKTVTKTVQKTLQKPEVKEANKEPIKKSVLNRLEQKQVEADRYNAARKATTKKHDMEL